MKIGTFLPEYKEIIHLLTDYVASITIITTNHKTSKLSWKDKDMVNSQLDQNGSNQIYELFLRLTESTAKAVEYLLEINVRSCKLGPISHNSVRYI